MRKEKIQTGTKDRPKFAINFGIVASCASLCLCAGALTASGTPFGSSSELYGTKLGKVSQDAAFTLKGTVIDQNGDAVIGARVSVKGQTGKGTVTDIDGAFSLSGMKVGDTIEVAYIGYATLQVTLENQNPLSITLHEDEELLEEVVVVGYGTQKKVNLTGSISNIEVESIKDRASTNILTSLQGAIPGVTIISRPGSTPSINFRGRGNLGSSEPLYVIDGTISTSNDFANLDPNSIESISFLKDAASSSIYGSRAAYGVVLVSTKDGSNGKVRLTYSGMVGWKNPTYIPKTVSSADYARLSNEAIFNTNPEADPVYTEEEIGWFEDGRKPDLYPNSNWYDLIYRKNVLTTQHSVAVSGGDKVRFYSNLGYIKDNHFLPGRDMQRFNLNANFNTDITDWLMMRGSIRATQRDEDRKMGTPGYTNMINIPSTYVGIHSDGSFGTVDGGKQASKTSLNFSPLRQLYDGSWSTSRMRIITTGAGLDIKPVEGLKLSADASYNAFTSNSKSFTSARPELIDFLSKEPIAGTDRPTSESQMSITAYERTHLITNLVANYSKIFAEKHDFSILVGTSYEDINWSQSYGYRKNFPNNDLEDIASGSNTPENTYFGGTSDNQPGMSQYKLFSLFGRINYAYDNRYLLEVNLRGDASSRFHSSNRSALFPSASVGWRLSEESFMEGIDWLYNLKLRASYGTLGNINNVGDYDYISTYAKSESYIFDDAIVEGYSESKPANEALSWEKVAIFDVGLDAAFFDNKLSFVADYYRKHTSDILLTPNIPNEIGLSEKPSQNLGEVLNTGVEFAATWQDKVGDFSYSLSGNLSYNKNEILSLGDSDPIISAPWIMKVGHPIGEFYTYKTDGLLTEEDIATGNYITDGIVPNPGDIKYVDINGDGKLGGEDRTFTGNDVPYLTYGLNINLSYKNVSLSVAGQGVKGTKVQFESEMAHAFFDNATPRAYHLGRWTTSNPDPQAIYPRIYDRTNSHAKFNQYASDFWLFNADYFRVKNITLGYTFEPDMIGKIGLETAKAYVSLENFFTIRGDKRMLDFDPEASTGRAVSALGEKTISLGVNFSF